MTLRTSSRLSAYQKGIVIGLGAGAAIMSSGDGVVAAYEQLVSQIDVMAISRRLKEVLINRFGPVDVILFGSRARGDHRVDSDIDLAVVFEQLPLCWDDLLGELFDLSWDLVLDCGVSISLIPITRDDLGCGVEGSLGQNIRAEGIKI